MKRLLMSIVVGVTVFLSFAINFAAAETAYAQPAPWMPTALLADAGVSGKDLLTQLETEILPQLNNIFTPEQLEQFKADVASGTTFRKAFKSLTLTPEQKAKLKTVLKSVSKTDAFASLTPEQKKLLFMKKKEMMMPTAAEISDKIDAGMKAKGMALPEAIKQKIDAGMKQKEAFMPTPEEIGEKIKAGMTMMKDKMPD